MILRFIINITSIWLWLWIFKESLFIMCYCLSLYIWERSMVFYDLFCNLKSSFIHLILIRQILFTALISQILGNLYQFLSLFCLKKFLYLLINLHLYHFQNICLHSLICRIICLQYDQIIWKQPLNHQAQNFVHLSDISFLNIQQDFFVIY